MDKDAQELGDILDTVSEKVPKLLNGVLSTMYSAEAGENMGKAVGGFYRELLAAGIPNAEALEMAKSYMLSLKDVSNIVNSKNQ